MSQSDDSDGMSIPDLRALIDDSNITKMTDITPKTDSPKKKRKREEQSDEQRSNEDVKKTKKTPEEKAKRKEELELKRLKKEEDKLKREEDKKKKEEEKLKKEEEKKKKELEKKKREEEKEQERVKKEEEKAKKEEEKKKKEEEKTKKEEEKKKKQEEKEEEKRKKQQIEDEKKSKKMEEAKKQAKIMNMFVQSPVKVQPKPVVVAESRFGRLGLYEDPDYIIATINRITPLSIDEIEEKMKRGSELSAGDLLKEFKSKEGEKRKIIPKRKSTKFEINEIEEIPSNNNLIYVKMKYIKISQHNKRPGFHGTFKKKSKLIKPRRPFVQDNDNISDYENDSDDDWEDEPEGDDLNSDNEKDEKEDEVMDEKEQQEEEDEWVVPDGYLSEDEGTGVVNEDGSVGSNVAVVGSLDGNAISSMIGEQEKKSQERKTQLRELAKNAEAARNQTLKAVVIGVVFDINQSHEQYSFLNKFRMERLDGGISEPENVEKNEPVVVKQKTTKIKSSTTSTSSPSSPTKISPLMKPVNESDMPILIKALHGSSQSFKDFIKNFAETHSHISRIQLKYKINEISSRDPVSRKIIIKKEILQLYKLESLLGENFNISEDHYDIPQPITDSNPTPTNKIETTSVSVTSPQATITTFVKSPSKSNISSIIQSPKKEIINVDEDVVMKEVEQITVTTIIDQQESQSVNKENTTPNTITPMTDITSTSELETKTEVVKKMDETKTANTNSPNKGINYFFPTVRKKVVQT